MKTFNGNASTDTPRQSAFSRAVHSIRTRYSLIAAMFLLSLLALFYAGGRVVLVHLVRDTEEQVKDLGSDLARLAYRDADRARLRLSAVVGAVLPDIAAGRLGVRDLLSPGVRHEPLSLAIRLSRDGQPGEGACRDVRGEIVSVSARQISIYREMLAAWCRNLEKGQGGMSMPVGLLRLADRQHYVTLHPLVDGFLAVGVPFEAAAFAHAMRNNRSGMAISITHRQVDVQMRSHRTAVDGVRNDYGFVPLFSESANFYAGGFWDLGSAPFEAVFAVRDIAGNAVSMIAVSLPKTLASVTTLAISRLTFFVALVGILVVLPLFLIQ